MMSSYYTEVINKATGDKATVWCHDDYFGKHKYGYAIENNPPFLTEGQLEKDWRLMTEKEIKEQQDDQK